MPISYTLCTTGRVHSRASGTVDYADARAHLLAKRQTGILSLPEICDARDVTLDFSLPELRAIADEVRKRRTVLRSLPLLLVAP